ncbi:AT-rich interactive domain-containing protein 4A [Pimephales promelas]|uniref:AT-rich interactive domain-containing protein 4A n=1 Tax=Pimephales promelas TaxID=90988 RepID=UPI001955784B|nr:AT-rich interactive domain-containing protein 4A [Pimephales promelas]KAG1973199.1 AT-rich interactive domain-containing protein 4B [Pimephales promelas]
MKVADEPAYLTVGTDVSAKYRGAFCEAKIKTVKRMVKVKVMLKGDSTSQVVQDDQVKGPLRVGSTVEVKGPEGGLSEAVINKLTDASWYTVVFDDGDEKTLRRTSLCLKGERHFAESETLDQLPLTNPEHFGTPVIGKKTNRGRRSSQAVAEDEKESSSSEDDDDDKRRLNDDLLGKVACIQSGSDSDSCHYVLVISPSCNDDLTVKKDQCLVRSFADSKFHTVARKEVQEVNIDTLSKPEYSLKKGFEAAQLFLKARQVPDSWKVDLSEILESSSSDEDDGDGDGEGKGSEEEEQKKPEPDEPDDEPDPEERDHFLQQLYKFMEDRGTPINKPPVLGYKDLNLFKLFRLVYIHGGCDHIESGSIWKQIYMDLGIPVLNSAASYNVKTAYKKYLYGFEEYCRSAQIQFRTVHHNEPRPDRQPEAQSIKTVKKESEDTDEMMLQVTAEPGTSEDKPVADADESDAESEKGCKDICSPRGRRRCTLTPVKVEVREPVKQEKSKEEKKEEIQVGGENSGEEQKEKSDGETPGKRRSHRLDESDKDTDDEEQEDDEDEEEDGERSRLRDRDEREEGDCCEDSEHSLTGTKVKVKYGKGKTQKIYEANIKNTENDDGEVLYLVHYYGWNVRYDEWVKADRIIWPGDKGGTKRKQKKKMKNKEDGEEDKTKVRRGRPPLKSTPPSTSRSLSKTPSSEGRSSSKNSRPADTSALPNGDSTPRRRTRRTSGMYDSDRGSNDSGNSSDDSECEESPEKKLEWTERTDSPLTAKQLEAEDLSEESTMPEPDQTEPELPSSPQEMPNFKESECKPEEDASRLPVESDDGSPKPRAKKPRLKEPGSETQTPPAANHTETEEPSTPPRPLKKSQETPHNSPVERIKLTETAGSDTDSATEDIGPPERSNALKRKITEQRTPEKKIRLDRKEEPKALSPVKTPLIENKPEPEKRDEEKPEDLSTPTLSSPCKDIEMKSEMPALTREVLLKVEPPCPRLEDPTTATNEEMMPQIGPEALVCHEVDLDDPEEKEKPSGEEILKMMEEEKAQPEPQPLEPADHLPHVLVAVGPPRLFSPSSTPSPDESQSTKGESDATIEVDSVAESQEGLGENESTHSFDASASSSNSSISLQDRDGKDRGQKRLLDCITSSSAKKQKRSQKRSSAVCKTEKNGAGHSSDSEDLPAMDSSNKLTPVKHSSLPKSQKLSRSPGMVSPNSKDMEKDKHKEKQSIPSPRTHKWSCQLTELDNMSSTERISFLQKKLQEIRKYYMSLKSEVASIDRRRKRLKKKEREVSHTTASTSSGSSDTGMSPSSASPTQNTVAVECR